MSVVGLRERAAERVDDVEREGGERENEMPSFYSSAVSWNVLFLNAIRLGKKPITVRPRIRSPLARLGTRPAA